jgi:hypothetical protein
MLPKTGCTTAFPHEQTFAGTHRTAVSCQKRALLATQPPLKSLPLISPRQQWHLHQRYDCGLRRLHTLNAFTGRLKKGEFACKFYVRQCLDGAEHINIDQNLSILSLIAKSGGEIRHLARN